MQPDLFSLEDPNFSFLLTCLILLGVVALAIWAVSAFLKLPREEKR